LNLKQGKPCFLYYEGGYKVSFKKGDIFTWELPEREVKKAQKSGVLNDYHRVVVLHTRQTPYKVFLIAPITSADSLKKIGKVPTNYVELQQDDYPFILDHTSYINLDMTMPVDEDELQQLERWDKKIEGSLTTLDLFKLDQKISMTYELIDYFDDQLARQFKTVHEYINENIKEQIKDTLNNSGNANAVDSVMEILDKQLLDLIKTEYIESKDYLERKKKRK
jgi:uncharacterized protein YifN (PemK superfamily)